MDELTPEQQAARSRQALMVVLLSFFFSEGVLLFVLWTMTSNGPGSSGSLRDAVLHPMTLPFSLAASCFAVGSFALKKLLEVPKAPPAAGGTPKGQLATLAAYVLSEAPALLGFLLGVTTHSLEIAVPFFCLSAILLVLHFPRA